MFSKLASFAYEPDTDFRIGYNGPRALQGIGDPLRITIEHQKPGLGRLFRGLRDVTPNVSFDIQGLNDKLSRRPLAKDYADGHLQVAYNVTTDPSQLLDIQLLRAQVTSSTDPLPDGLADQVRNVVLAAYQAANGTQQEIAQDTADKQSTYEFFRDLPSDVGKMFGAGLNAPLNIAGAGLWEVVKNIATNPTTWLVVGGAYFFFFRKRRS